MWGMFYRGVGFLFKKKRNYLIVNVNVNFLVLFLKINKYKEFFVWEVY